MNCSLLYTTIQYDRHPQVIGVQYVDRSLVFAAICLVGVLCLAVLEFGGMKPGDKDQDQDVVVDPIA